VERQVVAGALTGVRGLHFGSGSAMKLCSNRPATLWLEERALALSKPRENRLRMTEYTPPVMIDFHRLRASLAAVSSRADPQTCSEGGPMERSTLDLRRLETWVFRRRW
jgi:hypothetical protein